MDTFPLSLAVASIGHLYWLKIDSRTLREDVDSPPESASHFPIEIQIIPMNMMKQFYEQRANFIEARLMGKEGGE